SYCHRVPLVLRLMRLPPPGSPLFPYTTLFRSCLPAGYGSVAGCGKDGSPVPPDSAPSGVHPGSGERGRRGRSRRRSGEGDPQGRSEEHTSELQSRENLVCRLLLEKKKTRDTRG